MSEMTRAEINQLVVGDHIVHLDEWNGFYAYDVSKITSTTIVLTCTNRQDLKPIHVRKTRFNGYYRRESAEGMEIGAQVKFRLHKREIADYFYCMKDNGAQARRGFIEKIHSIIREFDSDGFARFKLKEL